MASTPTAPIGNEAPVENASPLSNAAIDDILAQIEKFDAGETGYELKRSASARELLRKHGVSPHARLMFRSQPPANKLRAQLGLPPQAGDHGSEQLLYCAKDALSASSPAFTKALAHAAVL
jgi:hypothetical protein